jgi:tetratricopeptide (TPR) repeat protein
MFRQARHTHRRRRAAWVLKEQGKYEEAEQMGRRALEGHEKVLRSQDPAVLGARNNLAVLLSDQGKYEEAEQMH